MARAWTTLDRVASHGGRLELRQRGEREFLITVAGRVLMTSAAHRSECALAEWVCGDLARAGARLRSPAARCASADSRVGLLARGRPRVLIGGLGMGYTLRAALDALPPGASVSVAELEPAVVAWCRGPLASLTGAAVRDPRVEVILADVMEPVRAAARGERPRLDAIALDLSEGPRGTRDEEDHPLWGLDALAAIRDALVPGGALGIWSEQPAAGLPRRLARVGLRAETRRAGRGGRRHTLYRAQRPLQARGRAGRNVRSDGALDSGHR